MKCDVSTKVYRAWGVELNQANVNKYVKAVILNFGDERGDIIVENDNFGTHRKYADFTNGKKKMPKGIIADVAPVRHGRWVKHGCKWQCTNCKLLMSIDGTPKENLLNYCPNCGAKMDGDMNE